MMKAGLMVALTSCMAQWVFATDPVLFPDFVCEKAVMVPMRDGVLLATDTYHPAINGKPVEDKLPPVLHGTPYNKEGGARDAHPTASFFCPHGYVVAFQDCRGRYKNSPERQELMEPGSIYEFTITPFTAANVFKKGQRDRLPAGGARTG